MQRPLTVTVLSGGPDPERDISLTSGRAVAASLAEAGHCVKLCDATPDDLSALDVPCDVVFPAMHGAWGEGGPLQLELEQRGFAYVGSGPEAAAVAMDKAAAKRVLAEAGLPVPQGELATTAGPHRAEHGVVIKPVSGGSSLDVFIRPDGGDITEPVNYLVARYGRCIIEELVVGFEMTVGILGDIALPPIWIDTSTVDGGWFDYAAKYQADGARHRFDLPPTVDAELAEQISAASLAAHSALGCRDLSRADLIVRRDGTFALLEVNTMPGFTGRSLLPDAARQAGVCFAELCDRLVQVAASRGRSRAEAA